MRLAQGRPIWTFDSSGIALNPECRGNVAIWRETEGELSIASEWTGSFPLYYVHRPGEGFLFSSRMVVIASALRNTIDAVGVVEFLREASFQSSRSLWRDVHRLQPGQSLVYRAATDKLSLTERSQLWTSTDIEATHPDIVNETWSRLGLAVDANVSTTIMMSGGWDSRTLLARSAACSPVEALMAYSHGDLASREIRLAQCLSGEIGVAFHQEPIDYRCYNIHALRLGFDREGDVVFPHWHRAGQIAASTGPRIVTAGVYGEVLGGHYGRAMLLHGSAKIREVARRLLTTRNPSQDTSPSQLDALTQFLHVPRLDRPWPLQEEWWRSSGVSVSELNSDIDQDVRRLMNRGVRTIDQLIEAYITEHRGSQYINAQIRSCRAYTDVSLPFTDRSFLEWVCALPMTSKIHNRLNQRLLARYAPTLLQYPLAATLAMARRPVIVQEASRFVRKGLEAARWRANAASRGRIRAPRLSWVNFEFLRTGHELRAIVDDLKADLWDKPALLARLDQLANGDSTPTHSMSDQMMKIYTIDLSLRSV